MSLRKRISGLIPPSLLRSDDESDSIPQEELDRIAEGVAPLQTDEEMDWGEPRPKLAETSETGDTRSDEEKKAAVIAEVKAILDSIPRPGASAVRANREETSAKEAARRVLAAIGHPQEPEGRGVAPEASRGDTPERRALIHEAMGHWAQGHDILSRMDPKIRKRIRALADQMLPD